MMNKKSGKRVLSWLLAAAMLIALMPANALAEPPTESGGSTETTVEFRCPDSEGSAEVSVGDYDSSTTTEALFKDISSDVLSFDADSAEDSLKEGTIEGTETPVRLDKAVVLEDGNVPETQEELEKEGTEISAVVKTDNDIAYLPATGGKPVDLGEDQTLVIIYTPEEETPDADADNQGGETKDEVTADGIATIIGGAVPGIALLKDNKSYPVYVYGRFVNGNTTLNRWDKIKVNGNNEVSVSELYFGEKTTNEFPKRDNSEKVIDNVKSQLAESPFTKGGFSTDDVDSWEASPYYYNSSWYLYGNIRVYKIEYKANGGDASTLPRIDYNTYYYGTYTIPTEKPSTNNNKVFAGWTVNGDTNGGKYYQSGDTLTLKDFDKNNTGKITLKAQWEDKKFPVYVYGCFKYGNKTFDNTSKLYINGSTKAIDLNKDSFITFGKLDDATTFDPTAYTGEVSKDKISTTIIENRIKNGDVALSGAAGSAKTNGLLKNKSSKDITPLISSWFGLKSCPGATDYDDEKGSTWHLDGVIKLYKVNYEKGNIPDGEDYKLPEETTYFLGDYTVQKMETSSKNYKFIGWKYNGETYQEGDKIDDPNHDITLVAKWEKKEEVYKVNYEWDGNIPNEVKDKLPTDSTEYPTEEAARKSSENHAFATIDADNGTYTFSGWNASVGEPDYSGDKIVTTITFTGTWTFTPKPVTIYKVAYVWDTDAPTDVYLPTKDNTEYDSPDDVLAAVKRVDTSNFTSSQPKGNIAGTWSFKGWNEGTTSKNENGHVTTYTITYIGSWDFTPNPVTIYKVAYKWADDSPSDAGNPPTDDKDYASPEAVQAAADGMNTSSFTSSKPKDNVAGTWTFDKWKESSRSSSTVGHVTTITITYTGTWKFTPNPVTIYKVAYKWAGDIPSDAGNPPTDDKDYASPEAVQDAVDSMDTTRFKSSQPKGNIAGTWTFNGWTEDKNHTEAKDGHVTTITITYIGSWNFIPNPVWKLNYKWDGQVPTNLNNETVVLPSDNSEYTSEEDALSHKDSTYKAGNYITENGVYTFTGWGKVSEQKDEKTNVTTIYLEGTWSFVARKYQAVYSWTDAPTGLDVPESKEYNSKDDIFNSAEYKLYKDGDTYPTSEGIYTFHGWIEGEESTNSKGTLTTIPFTGNWAFESKQYKVAYDWNSSDGVPGDVTLPTNGNSYGSVEEAKAAMDTVYSEGYTSHADKGSQKGLWTFSGWEASDPVDTADGSNTATITFKGSWKFTEKVVPPAEPFKATLTFKIENGTWLASYVKDDKTNTDDILVYLTSEKTNSWAMPAGTSLPDGVPLDNYENGQWYKLEADGTTRTLVPNNEMQDEVITGDVTYILVFTAKRPEIQPDTILDVLNNKVTIEKFFEARYNRSTSGTFTVAANVNVKRDYEVQAIVTKDESIGTFKSDVTLNTGEKETFKFDGEDIALEESTSYTITVAEEASHQSYVTDDETIYTITFSTDADGKITTAGITIKPDNGEATKDTTITFHNIYTYKRHHSSDDGGNGGKKDEKPTVEITDDDALGLNDTDHFAYIVGYGNGEVRPQNSITRAEVAAIFFRLLEDDVRDANYTRQNKFTDVSNDAWYCSAVSTLSAMGIISGYPDATFRPNASITRAEFAAIATRFDVNGDKTPVSFSDIAGHWAKDEIAVAANNGWVNGYEDGSFRPQNKITRAETMSLVNRVLNRRPETAEDLLENMTKWTDNADTNAWYYLAVQEATNSHYYEYKENSQYEKWTELRETRDWSELDK